MQKHEGGGLGDQQKTDGPRAGVLDQIARRQHKVKCAGLPDEKDRVGTGPAGEAHRPVCGEKQHHADDEAVQ